MKIAIVGIVLTAIGTGPAGAEDNPRTSDLKTIDAISIFNVLTDKEFKEFKFKGTVRMTFAHMITALTPIKQGYDEALIGNRILLAGATGKDVPKEKIDDFVKMNKELLDAPSGVTLPKIDLKDFCLDATPQECSLNPPAKNEIPPAWLSALAPIIKE